MNDIKQLMRMSKPELLGLGEKYGLAFEDSMKKSQMATALQQSMASGWLQENEALMGTSEQEEEEFAGNISSDMLSDSAHVAQMLASAGFTETFHNAMSDSLAHREVIESYLERLGANPDDVWKHLPRHNPNVTAPHWGEMRSYMENTLTKHQDIMPEIRGHYAGDIMGEYQTSKGDVKQTYDYLAQMYVDKGSYNNENLYNKDIQRVSTALAKNMERAFIEVSASAGMGAKVSYMDILPQIGDSSIVGGVVHPREPLNSAGLPLGSSGSAVAGRGKYSLSASLTGRPDSKGGVSSDIWKDVSDTVKQLSRIYTSGGSDKTSIGLNPYGVETSEKDMILDSATRYVDIEEARSGYENLYEPSYSGSTIRAIINNTYDKMDSQAKNIPSAINANQPSFRISSSTSWEAEMQQPTTWNSARDRRLEKQIADFDAQGAHEQEAIEQANPIKFHNLEQGSDEWLRFREQYDITGSTVGGYLGNSTYTRPWKTLTSKLGLHPNAYGGNNYQKAMFERGHKTEESTRRRLEREMGIEIAQTGAITNEQYPGMMYSPDGLIGDDTIWEHKNPERAGKFADLSKGDHPDYMDQIQMGMMISGRKRALFSQTIGNEVRNEWVDYDPEWYGRNKTKLDSVRGRLAEGREFLESNPDLPLEDKVAGARRIMTGEGIWKDVSQRSNRGYSPNAGTERDEYLGKASTYNPNLSQPSQDYSQSVQQSSEVAQVQSQSQEVANVPAQNSTDPSLSPAQANMAIAVKSGILMAQEENKRAGGAGGGGFGGGGDGTGSDADFPPDPNDPFGDGRRGRGRQGGDGGRRGREEGIFDSGAFGTIAEGISRGTMASTRGGVMQALREGGPIGQTLALGIGALGVGGEAISNMSDYLGMAQDYGSDNPIHFASMQQGLEMMGLSGEQATRTNLTTHSAYNTLLNGDPSGALRIIRGTRGLVTLSDIRETEGDPVALAERIRSKASERGWSQQRIAGAMQMAGLDGMARAVARPETQGYASGLVGERGQEDTSDFNHSIAMQNATRAFVSPDYFAQRYATGETSQNVLTGVAQGMKEGYMALDSGVGAIDSGLQKVYNQFNKLSSQIKGAVSGDQFEAQDYGEAGVELGAQRDADGNLANLINGTMFWESRGRDYKADGTPMTSSTGAKYAMQVLPSSARQPGYGIKPAQDDSPEEYNRVGREIIEVMNKKYDGDWRKVASAYSDGAGTVDKAVKLYGDDWLSHMPEQAQNRVKAMEQAGFGQMGAGAFSQGNYGVNNINVNVNIDAKINNQTARANVTSGNQTVTQAISVGNGVMQQVG